MPLPPSSTSAPVPPVSRSLPPSPSRVSMPAVPTRLSAPAVPVLSTMTSLHATRRGTHAGGRRFQRCRDPASRLPVEHLLRLFSASADPSLAGLCVAMISSRGEFSSIVSAHRAARIAAQPGRRGEKNGRPEARPAKWGGTRRKGSDSSARRRRAKCGPQPISRRCPPATSNSLAAMPRASSHLVARIGGLV